MRNSLTALLVAAGLFIAFSSGYFVGHRSHHYVHLGTEGVLLYDETTGHICNGISKPTNVIDAALPQGFVLDSNGSKDVFDKLAGDKKPTQIPYCGDE